MRARVTKLRTRHQVSLTSLRFCIGFESFTGNLEVLLVISLMETKEDESGKLTSTDATELSQPHSCRRSIRDNQGSTRLSHRITSQLKTFNYLEWPQHAEKTLASHIS